MFGNQQVTREILGNVPSFVSLAFYLLAAAACGFAAFGFYSRYRQQRRSASTARKSQSRSWRVVLEYLLFQREIRRDPYAGVAHLLVVYGFLILFWGTCLVFLEQDTPLHFFYGWFYQVASLIVDLGGVAFLVGLGMFLWRRHRSCKTPVLREWWVASLTWLLFAIGVTGFVLEAFRIAPTLPDFERWSVVGYCLACTIRIVGFPLETLANVHRLLWIGHAALCLVFFALLPWQFFSHMVYGLASWYRRSDRPISQLVPSGRTTFDERLELDACTTCGRCVSVCPANAAGKPLQPRSIILQLRSETSKAIQFDHQLNTTTSILDDALWSCTTCGACNSVCPVGIGVYHKIVSLRRDRVEQGIVPESAEKLFDDLAERDNPFGRSNAERLNWAHGLDVPVAEEGEPIELLYWVGCAGSFDPDGQSVARAMVQILKRMGLRYRVLGCRERCTGDPARRLGEEGLFQQQALEVKRLLREHCVKTILTHCPHCLNALRNEYPAIAAEGLDAENDSWTVMHHSEFLQRALSSAQLQVAESPAATITYHDPCYLARGQNVVDEPRSILKRIQTSALVEMSRNRQDSFCCGAGGGAMWVDVAGDDRVENLRAKEALSTGATTIVTGCPFCKSMLRSGVQKESPQPTQVLDLAEMLLTALEQRLP